MEKETMQENNESALAGQDNSSAVTNRDIGFWRETWHQVQLVWLLLKDPEVPIYLKLLPLAAVAYVIFPFDIAPDMIPLLGQLDDITAMLLGAKIFIEMSPQDVVARHLDALNQGTTAATVDKKVADSIIIDGDYTVGSYKKDRAG
jgi:uncharacterized membrane protein YkvA (DUF1232 family)